MKTPFTTLLIILIILTLGCSNTKNNNSPTQPIISTTISENVFLIEGILMELRQGNIYNKKSNQLVLKYYDPLFISKHYFEENEKMFLKAGNKHFEVGLNHTDGFEDINHVRDLINENRRWTGMSLLSPAAKM